MKRGKKLSLVIFTLALLLMAAVPALAQTQRVVDEASLFTEQEISRLEEQAAAVIEKTGADISILTADGFDGLSVYDYIEQYYEQYGYGKVEEHGGAVLVIDMAGREVHTLSTGALESYYKGNVTEGIIDAVYDDLRSGDYFACASRFISETEQVILKNEQPFLARLQARPIALSLLAGLGGGAVVVGIILLLHRNTKAKTAALHNYFTEKGVVLVHEVDQFVGTYTTRTAIPKDTGGSGGGLGGGGGGSSSSGRSFSGSSRKF